MPKIKQKKVRVPAKIANAYRGWAHHAQRPISTIAVAAINDDRTNAVDTSQLRELCTPPQDDVIAIPLNGFNKLPGCVDAERTVIARRRLIAYILAKGYPPIPTVPREREGRDYLVVGHHCPTCGQVVTR